MTEGNHCGTPVATVRLRRGFCLPAALLFVMAKSRHCARRSVREQRSWPEGRAPWRARVKTIAPDARRLEVLSRRTLRVSPPAGRPELARPCARTVGPFPRGRLRLCSHIPVLIPRYARDQLRCPDLLPANQSARFKARVALGPRILRYMLESSDTSRERRRETWRRLAKKTPWLKHGHPLPHPSPIVFSLRSCRRFSR